MSDHVRVASLQYLIRPITDFAAFEAQVVGLVTTAADYGVQLLVFPEYFTLQLLTLSPDRRPMFQQVRSLADRTPVLREMFQGLARKHDLHIVGGTMLERDTTNDALFNVSHLFTPTGDIGSQVKLHMTRFEREEWNVDGGHELRTFDTELGRLGIAICYDVEFPEVAREHARQGAQVLVVPSCTDDRQAFLRVRHCAQARTIENQMYVVQSSTVGSLPQISAVALNYGQASILTPSDFRFGRDGIAAEGIPNQEAMVIADVDLRALGDLRGNGSVLPLIDSERRRHEPIRPSLQRLRALDEGEVHVRNTKASDFDAIIALTEQVYPSSVPWSKAQLAAHLEHFPEGQFVAVTERGSIVGMSASLIIRWDDYEATADWRSFTSAGTFANHDPLHGRTLYGAEVMVAPDQQGRGVGRLLYEARQALAVRLRLLRIRAGARLRGFSAFSEKSTPADYVAAVIRGDLHDATLSFQLRRGFRVIGLVSDYLRHDPESQGHAAIIEWLNPALATPADYAAQPRGERLAPVA